jgi:hypothetical protein
MLHKYQLVSSPNSKRKDIPKIKGNNPFGSFPSLYIFPSASSGSGYFNFRLQSYLLCLIFAWAAAKRAIGTRYGEQLT